MRLTSRGVQCRMPVFDVVILGSGFAGSLFGLILQKQGLSVLVIDRARHPRFAIGESSTPAADFILESLCDRYGLSELRPLCRYGSWCRELPQISRGLKRGFSYFHQQPHEPYSPGVNHENELLVAANSCDEVGDTHWYRADVDQYVAVQFVASGGELWEETQVETARQENSGWEIQGTREGAPISVRAHFLVDGTGGDSALVRWLDLQSHSEALSTHSRSLFGHFADVRLWSDLLHEDGIDQSQYPYPCDQAALHQIIDGGWMWVLRFDNETTSIGWSLDCRKHPLPTDQSSLQEWAALLDQYPAVARHLANARPVAPFTVERPLIRTERLQRLVSPIAGDNWALLPHTAGFIDPFYSTGIAHSLLGVERLADIIPRLPRERTSELERYSQTVVNEIRLIDQLVSLAYRCMGHDPRLLHAASMIYFAGATTFEARRRGGSRGDFLLVDDPEYCRVVHELTTAYPDADGIWNANAVADWTALVERRIAPWNSVGLFQPRHDNMYWHTAAGKDSVSARSSELS
jgi:FADH2 O2-dependent halogenase